LTDYLVIYERAEDGSWSARAADLPVYAVGASRDEAEREIQSAIGLHLEELRRNGDRPPSVNSVAGVVSV
jgi:predicted RNase H-like HicB family nuclease